MQNVSENVYNLLSGGAVQFDLLASEIQVAAQRAGFLSHPLGFFRMRIGAANGGPLYLHVWLPDRSVPQVPRLTVHAHSVSITSYIIMGEIEDYRYAWTDDLNGAQRLFKQNRAPGGPPLLRTSRVGFTSLVSSSRFRAMDRYTVPFPEFHESAIRSAELTATICNFLGESNNDPLVVAPADVDRIPDYKVVALDEAKKSEVMQQVVDGISKIRPA